MAPTAPRKAEKDPTVTATDADASEASKVVEPAKDTDKGSDKAESGTEYLNTTNGWLIYDKEGHGVAGGEWTPPVNLDAIGKAARALGHLLPRSAL